MKKSIGVWQMLGFIFTGVMGTLLHFLYDWSGQNPVVGAFSAVNESVWEHTKLLFFPMLVYAVLEYWTVGRADPNFWGVKAMGSLLGIGLITALYYTYTGSLGINVDWFNIAIFFIAAAVVFWVEAKLLKSGRLNLLPLAGVGLLIFMGLLYIMLTFYPPELPLFQPPVS